MNPATLRQLVTYAVAVGAAFAFARQCRKPKWLLGRFVLAQMNAGHSRLTQWGLSHLEIQRDATVLDVGCGTGRVMEAASCDRAARLARLPEERRERFAA